MVVQAKQAETEKRVSDLAAQLEALQHENEALHQQNLTLQSALVVRASAPAPAPAPAPASAPDSPASTSGQVRGVARLTSCLGMHTFLLGCSCSW
jgi:Tfp pilus assembly protein FimV